MFRQLVGQGGGDDEQVAVAFVAAGSDVAIISNSDIRFNAFCSPSEPSSSNRCATISRT